MARKFNIGDKVKVIAESGTCSIPPGFKIGITGIIRSYDRDNIEYPYQVSRLRHQLLLGYFKACELELIKRKEK